ncbi:MAG: hypothetical protein LBH60_00445 [Prevotellaceae bacterium]|nr:hypothetical protein [Prevotellaceae bacterium]
MIANDSKNSKCHDNDNDNDIKTTYPNDSELSNNNSINRDADNITPPERGRVDKSTKLNNSARIVFETHFLETFGSEYYWTAKDAGNMRKLIEKLKFQREKKGLENDDDNVLYALKVFLESIRDGWIFENFSVPNINSKFNEIISNAKKNGTNRRNSKAPYSPEELRAIVSAGIGLAKAAKDG